MAVALELTEAAAAAASELDGASLAKDTRETWDEREYARERALSIRFTRFFIKLTTVTVSCL
jgi:hypothetical protein